MSVVDKYIRDIIDKINATGNVNAISAEELAKAFSKLAKNENSDSECMCESGFTTIVICNSCGSTNIDLVEYEDWDYDYEENPFSWGTISYYECLDCGNEGF